MKAKRQSMRARSRCCSCKTKTAKNEATTNINFKYSNNKVNPELDFEQQPSKLFMKQCNEELKKKELK